jgi:hypothetical protein
VEQHVTRAIANSDLRAAVVRALHGARHRLEAESCGAVLHEFRHLAAVERVDWDAAALRPSSFDRLLFRDGRDNATCLAGGIAAFTGTGSRVVFVCDRFAHLDRARAELILLHELLHTVGVPERPPTPAAIDRAVASRCGA